METVYCQAPDVSFVLERSGEEGGYIMRKIGNGNDLDDLFHELFRRPLYSPFAIWGFPLRQIMSDQGFTIKEVFPGRVHGRECLKVAFGFNPGSSFDPRWKSYRSGWFVVSPDAGWTIQEYSLDVRSQRDIINYSIYFNIYYNEYNIKNLKTF